MYHLMNKVMNNANHFISIVILAMYVCLQDAHHSLIDDYEVIVDYNRQQLMPGWIPRRLGQLTFSFCLPVAIYMDQIHVIFAVSSGGGFGGKKESGQLRFGGRERPFRAPMYVASLPYLCKVF